MIKYKGYNVWGIIMSKEIKYYFDKSQYYYRNADRPVETVGVIFSSGVYDRVYHPDQYEGVERDPFNQRNVLKHVSEYVSKNVTKIKFSKDMSVNDALHVIYTQIGNPKEEEKIDKLIHEHFAKLKVHNEKMVDYESYRNLINMVEYYTPDGIRAMVNGEKYPLKAAVHDFARGVDRKKFQASFDKLPTYLKRRFRSLCEKNNYVLTDDLLSQDFKPLALDRFRPTMDDGISVDVLIGRTADEFLRDAAKYKYYKLTGNMDIFLSKFEQMSIDAMSDHELAIKYGVYATQRYENALIVKRHIESLVEQNKDISNFIGELYRYSVQATSSYCNPDIVRMMFETIKKHSNKFKQSKQVMQYMGLLYNVTLDAKLRRDIADTFGIKPDETRARTKMSKQRVKQSLRKAEKRISSGDYVFDGAVQQEVIALEEKYGMSSGPETFGKVKKLIKPTKTQMKIAKEFSERSK